MTVIGRRTKRTETVTLILTIGTYHYLHGDKYEGEWKNDEKDGKGTVAHHTIGTLTYSNGDQYKGNFSANKKNGQGTLTLANGERYEGEWNDDRKTGKGKLKPNP